MQQDYDLFIRNIKKKTGIDLSQYKEVQMKRRLKSLYEKKGFYSFKSFYDGISRDPALLDEFLDRMTINVSGFYRNRKRWEILENKILPPLLSKKKGLRIWSAACATGEEPYTIAMILSKLMPLSRIRVFATDIDENVIAKAKFGVYPENSLNELPNYLRKKYFTQEGNMYRLSEEIKSTVTFKKQNLLLDSYGGPYDLIVCRNVLIYFTEDAKESIYRKFGKALTTGGVLFVGSTEQIFNPAQYQFISEDTFFYKKV